MGLRMTNRNKKRTDETAASGQSLEYGAILERVVIDMLEYDPMYGIVNWSFSTTEMFFMDPLWYPEDDSDEINNL